ncbi:Spondin, N-terminal [Sergentomyia squamirostris]
MKHRAFAAGVWMMVVCSGWFEVNGQTTIAASANPANSGSCHTGDRLAVYKVVLHTYWTRELFPKHYPDWRPPAQWTRTIGEFIENYISFSSQFHLL